MITASRVRARLALTVRQRVLLLAGGIVGLLAGLVPITSPAVPVASAAPSLNGGGSSYAALEISQWRAEVARKPYELGINYVAQGSSFGRQQYLEGNLDFAVSDIPFQPAELAVMAGRSSGRTDKNYAYVPVSAGGLGFMYQLVGNDGQQITNLNLTRRAVCRIFTEANMYWDDPEIVAANPSSRLPHELVRPIVRSDGSGSSYVLSEYCITVAQDVWSAFVASRTAVDPGLDPEFRAGRPTSNWPQGWGVATSQLGGDGVAAAVADSTGRFAITYGEPGAAIIRDFPNASLQNGAGVFTQPTEDAASAALAYAKGRSDGTFELEYDGPDPAAYFPSLYSYAVVQTTGFPTDKGEVLARFLCYSITRGQRADLTLPLGYARLSAPLVELGKTAIAKIPGAPPWEQCRVDSAPPPTTPTTVPAATSTTVAGSTQTTAPGGGSATTTPSGGTQQSSSPGVTTAGGSTSGGSTSGGSTSGGSTSGGSTSGGSTSGGSNPVQTVVSVDPVTGETVVETVPAATGDCFDPVTGLPMDPSMCELGAAIVDGLIDAAADGATAGAGAGAGVTGAAAPAAYNPPIAEDTGGPDAGKIIWWLVQGASLCAVGVALAGAKKRLA